MLCFVISLWLMSTVSIVMVSGNGLMLLYQPRDVSNQCAYSYDLRYDLSFGMGMSDTITLVFRSLSEIDYKCIVEIVVDSEMEYLLVVVRYPNGMSENCVTNKDAITVIKKRRCFRLCDIAPDNFSSYIIFAVKSRIRFRFISNSSINADMSANLYQVTVTTARAKPLLGCNRRNETVCSVSGQDYCFTSGVVCDGIRNCGVNDWFDERKSQCGLPVEKLSYAPVIAVSAAILCTMLAVGHLLLRYLPPQASSFFIFNANEDNRLCIDPVLKTRGSPSAELEEVARSSLIPIFASSSSSENEQKDKEKSEDDGLDRKTTPGSSDNGISSPQRKITMRSMTAKIQEKLRLVTGRSRNLSIATPIDALNQPITRV